MPSSSSKNRNRSSVFDAIQELESQDVRASRKRKSSSDKDARKSKAARSQTKIHGHLMECRILLQRAMTTTTEEEHDEEETVQQCNQVLSQLLEARARLTARNHDHNIDYKEIVESQELPNILEEEYEECRNEWKQVLDRRHKDLRLHAGLSSKTKFRVMDSSFWQQVDATLSHETLRATSSHDNSPVFDDSKVYQHMLQDFVVSSATVGGAEEAAAHRLKKAFKQTASGSTKKQVDRRASKGRKIRYVEIPKLVNFTFPVARPTSLSSGMNDDEFFKSLFGGAAAAAAAASKR
mmetsp:Transcript_17899/g.32364  ORF Transcript_17899/g.32364 Transcript_17899/m.32364 type:complete len:294 (+) Transcript_17899:77-958(+)